MRTAAGIAIAFVAVAAAGALVLFLGLYNVAATEQHTAPVYWVLEAAMRQSTRHHARGIAVPPLDDASRIVRGRALYDAHCVRCHGAPGVAPEFFALGLSPLPANLAFTARDWPAAELFWVIKYGIKMAGMPAWEFRLAEDDLWAIVAYLKILPGQSPSVYRASAPAEAPPSGALATATPASSRADPRRGRVALLQYACATCHEIPGVVGASAPVGPPLAGMGVRGFIAGVVPNTAENMIRWLRGPQQLHPQSAMPDLGVSEADARDIAAYLYTLR
jgi:mono/diheme cytochrome c family protein